MERFILPLTIGFFMDFILGDPKWMPHIVCLMGNIINKLENIIRQKVKNDLTGGKILVILMVLIFTIIPAIILYFSYGFNYYLGLFIEAFMCWQCIAAKSLKEESMKVLEALKHKGIKEGREAVGMIVGRDTQKLSKEGIIKATVETIAENTTDGVIAPLFYMAIGGGTLGFFYKAVNTMDSMVGYKNDKYINFGRAAAKFDDFVNFVPARLAAYLMVFASYALKFDGKNAYKIFKRDRFNHKSPNSAQTESVCAGALGVQLAGDSYYFGELYKKPTIGDNIRNIEAEDIEKSNKLMLMTSLLMMVVLNIIFF